MLNNRLHKVGRKLLLLLLTVLLAAGPSLAFAEEPDYLDDASYESAGEEIASIYDPLEPFNRAMFAVNDKLYLWVLDPVATGYSHVVPKDFRTIISNFFYNLGEPVRAVNCLLQGRFADSGLALSRFLINSTAGVFGLADPAGHEFNIGRVHRASLGQTFAAWGIGDGFYLVMPVLGPTTLRDLTGTVGDGFARGLYTPWNDDLTTTATVYSAQAVNDLSQRLGQYQELKAMTLDPYVAFRNGYAQLRQQEIGPDSAEENGPVKEEVEPAVQESPALHPSSPDFQFEALDLNYQQ